MKNNLRLISVIMSVYNEEPQWLGEAIDSILHQSYAHLEFIIIIDNPNNKVLLDVIQSFAQKDARIQYYINAENKGLIYSLNRALTYCKGEYIARMDADDISHLDRFEKQLLFLEDNHLDLIGSNVNLFRGNKEVFYTTNKILTHKYIKRMLAYATIGVVHPTFFARAKVFQTLEGYRNAWHTEDQEFLARVFCAGFVIGNIPDVLLDCRYSEESITKINAIYIHRMGEYLRKVFIDCIQKGKYEFDEYFYDTLKYSKEEINNFQQKQILMGEVRKALYDKKYILFFVQILKAMRYSSSVFSQIKMNVFLKILKLSENIVLRVQKHTLFRDK